MGTKIPTGPAAQFLTDECAKPTKEATLNSLRSTGKGPPFYKTGKYILYDTDDLLEWAKADPMVKYNSTSEYSTRKKKTPPNDGGE